MQKSERGHMMREKARGQAKKAELNFTTTLSHGNQSNPRRPNPSRQALIPSEGGDFNHLITSHQTLSSKVPLLLSTVALGSMKLWGIKHIQTVAVMSF